MLNKVTSWFKTYYKDVAVVLITFSVAWVQIYRFLNPPTTLTMLTRMTIDGGSLEYHFVNTNQISPFIKVCAMASEDQNLPFHSGMDFEAIQKAIHVNKKGKKVFGASTITQQVAKNVFLFPQRSYIRKALELYFTLWIETLWSKDKILEMYLNVAEMGVGIFGIEAAAQHYFHKSAKKLSASEAAAIAAVLPSPKRFKANPPSRYVARRKAWIQKQMGHLKGDPAIEALLKTN
jgi:monofunctional biosynthetic peptidoglycan transglycosylase